MDSIEKESRLCLICEETFKIKTNDIPISIVNSKIHFDNCIRLLNIEEKSYHNAYKWKWDARFDLPNFCCKCGEDIVLLSVYEESLGVIKEAIKNNVAKAKSVILKSTSDETRNFCKTVPSLFSADDISTSIKIQYYRSCAVRDWNPAVVLSRFDEEKKTEDDGIVDLSLTKEVVPLSRDEGVDYMLDFGDKFKCKICLTVITDRMNAARHVDAVHRKIKRFKCKYCRLQFSTKSNCRMHINKQHRHIESITPLSLAKFYSKLNYLRDPDADENEIQIQNDPEPFVKPLVIKCELVEEIRCLICYKSFDNGGVQISPEVFDSLSCSLNVNRWKLWKETSNSPTDLAMFCDSCFSLAMDLHFSKLEFDETQKKFDKLLLKLKVDLIQSIPINKLYQSADTCDAISKPISTAEKADYFRSLAVKEFTPIVRLFKIENFNKKPQKLNKWRTPHENSIFKLVKEDEIIIVDPEIADRMVRLTEEEWEFYFQYDGKGYLCRQCNYNFATANAANHHCNSKHKVIMRFQCKYCSDQFYHRHECAYHIASAHKAERVEIAAEIEKSITLSLSAKMKSADGVIKISKKPMERLPKDTIMKVGNAYKCTLCSKQFKNRTTVVVHQKIAHLKIYRYKCEFCNLKNHHKYPVLRHVKRVHPEKLKQNDNGSPSTFMNKRTCKKLKILDPATLDGIRVLQIPLHPKTNEYITLSKSRYSCKICGKEFIHRIKIVDHLQSLHFGVRNYQCKACNLKFYTVTHCKRHIRRIHPNIQSLIADETTINVITDPVKSEHVEPHCEKEISEITFIGSRKDPLSEVVEYPEGEETLVEIPMKGELDIDVLPFTFDIEDPYLCETNGSTEVATEVESRNYSLSYENRNCAEVDTQKYSKDEEDLISSSKTKSTKDPAYKLIKPGNVIELSKNPNYEKELKKGYKKTAKGFQCLKCDKISKRFTVFRQHWGNIHDTSGGFECSICQKRFYFKFKCAQHYIIKHTKLQPYICGICDKTFANNSSLEYHVKLHVGERPFACSACPLKFVSELKLLKHFENHHMKILGK